MVRKLSRTLIGQAMMAAQKPVKILPDAAMAGQVRCANCGNPIKSCPHPGCVRNPPWVHDSGSHRCPGATGMVLAAPKA